MTLNKLTWYKNRLQSMSFVEILYRIWKRARLKILKLRYVKNYTYLDDDKHFPSTFHQNLPRINKKFYFDYLDESYINQYKEIFPSGIATTLKVAEEICDGKLNVLGLGKIDFGRDINWHSGILTQNSWPMDYAPEINFRQRDDIGDIRFIWEINRHLHFVILSKAYFLSGDEKYLDCLIYQFNHWIKKNPLLIGVNWSNTMELAIRVNSWIWCYGFIDKFNNDKAEKLKRNLLKGINQHCLFIEKNFSFFSSANNHLIVEATVLCIAGILFRTLPYAERWLEKGLKILKKELKKQVHPDGVNAEQAFHYQAFVMEVLFLLIILARKTNIGLPKIIDTSLKNMCEFFAEIIDQNGNIPEVGDSDEGQIVNLTGQKFNYYKLLLTLGAVVFNNSFFKAKGNYFNEQAYWLLGPEGLKKYSCLKVKNKNEGSKIFKKGGYGIIKYKDKEKERIMLFDFAPIGLDPLAAHGHADALSITLSIDGKPVFIDPGTYIYNVQQEWRNYFRRTVNHNTICINSKDQSVIGGPFLWTKKAKAKLIQYTSNDQYEFISAQHDGYKPLIHKRSIFFIKPDLWVILDTISGSSSYQFELTYNIASGIQVLETKNDELSLLLREGKILYMQFNSNEDFSLNICPNWVSYEFGKKEEGRSIKLKGKSMKNTTICSIISLGQKPEVFVKNNDITIGYGDKSIILSSEGNIHVEQGLNNTAEIFSRYKKIKFMGIYIDALDMNQSLARIEQIIRKRIPVQHVVVNAAKIVMLNSNRKLRDIINSCGMVNADGQAVVWAARLLGKHLPERVTGIDLMYNIIKMAYEKGFSIYFLGAKQKVVEVVVSKFSLEYPGLKIAGYRNGYFTDEDNNKIIDEIKNSHADILFVAFSSPKKEYWLAENIDKLNVPFCMGVGGSFDVVAGLTKRAPLWMQRAGLEWFYRFIQEPKRMWKRYFMGNIKFAILVIKEIFGLNNQN